MTTHSLLFAGTLAAVALASPMAFALPIIDYTGATVRGDFDGDGELDTAASSPQHDCQKGAVYVVEADGDSKMWTRNTAGIMGIAACSDRFGASLATGDLDKDGFDDLIIGVPGASDAGPSFSGAIQVIYGSASGLTSVGDQLWHQNTAGVQGVAESFDYFGDRLAVGDFDCNTAMDIAIGVPREAIGSVSDAGAVGVLYSTSSGVTSVDDIWYQGTAGVNGSSESGDYFGAALAAGNFNGDNQNGDRCDDLAIGAPREDWGSTVDAGMVYIIDGGPTGLETLGDQLLVQATSSVEGQHEAQDFFGQYLHAGNLDGSGAQEDLIVGIPGDGCAEGGIGSQFFPGSRFGLSTDADRLSCDTYGCRITGDNYACAFGTNNVRGLTTSETMHLSQERDVVWAGSGNDTITANPGDDVLFGGSGNDTFAAGGGMDIQIGGNGNDTFIIDSDCYVGPGEVIDGGAGTDTIRSHMTQAQLLAAGVLITSIENFVIVGESDGHCEPVPYIGPGILQPKLTLSWTSLPESDSIASNSNGFLPLKLVNAGTAQMTVTITASLSVSDSTVEQELDPIVMAAHSTQVVTLDLHGFLPPGFDLGTVDPSTLVIPVSAMLRTSARVTTTGGSGEVAESPSAPAVYGHVEGNNIITYRTGARDGTYFGGKLYRYRAATGGPAPT